MSETHIELVHGVGHVEHAVIWLHGLGASANDFPPVVPELGLDETRAIRFIFPQAPIRAITINGGLSMPGWYDIKGMDLKDKEDAVGIAESQATLEALIEQQIQAGIKSSNIIIAGFSQGGAVAYHTALRFAQPLAGLLALSTYLVFTDLLADECHQSNQDIPILINHGIYDQVVPISLGRASAETLEKNNYSVQWQDYPMEHQVIFPQIKAIGAWINSIFSK